MKKLLLSGLFFLLIFKTSAFADVTFFSENNKFGAKDAQGCITVNPEYNKLIRLGDNALIAQKGSKFGILDTKGNILIPFKYRHAERVLGKHAKLGNYGDYGLYDETGFAVIPPVYDSIDILFGGMLLTYKDYKYGVSDFSGKVIFKNVFDDIYMPKPNVMNVKYKGEWYEIEQVSSDTLKLPDDVMMVKENPDFKITNIVVNTGVISGYSVLSFSDYVIKIISSISPAHEQTIDQLMLSQGADTVNILIKFSWIPRYPYNFARNYYKYLRNPNKGMFAEIRTKLKNKIKNN